MARKLRNQAVPKRAGAAPSNLYRRGKVWWFRTSINGIEYRGSLQTRAYAEARARLVRKLDELRAPPPGPGDRLWEEAVAAYATEHLDGKTPSVAPRTANRYRGSWKAVEQWLAGKRLREIDTSLLGVLVSARKSSGVSNATINRDLTAISVVLSAAQAKGWLDRNPARDFPRRFATKERRPPLTLPTREQVEAVATAAGEVLGNLFRFLFATGLRISEAGGLTWDQVLDDGRTLRLTRTKGGRVRTLALSEDAQMVLARAAERRRPGVPFVFWHEPGERFRQLSARFLRARQAAEATARSRGETLPRFSAHALRHAFAVNWLQAGGGIYALSRHLGHTSVKTTEIYLRYLTESQQERALRG